MIVLFISCSPLCLFSNCRFVCRQPSSLRGNNGPRWLTENGFAAGGTGSQPQLTGRFGLEFHVSNQHCISQNGSQLTVRRQGSKNMNDKTPSPCRYTRQRSQRKRCVGTRRNQKFQRERPRRAIHDGKHHDVQCRFAAILSGFLDLPTDRQGKYEEKKRRSGLEFGRRELNLWVVGGGQCTPAICGATANRLCSDCNSGAPANHLCFFCFLQFTFIFLVAEFFLAVKFLLDAGRIGTSTIHQTDSQPYRPGCRDAKKTGTWPRFGGCSWLHPARNSHLGEMQRDIPLSSILLSFVMPTISNHAS